jgi:hypothetical protein
MSTAVVLLWSIAAVALFLWLATRRRDKHHGFSDEWQRSINYDRNGDTL